MLGNKRPTIKEVAAEAGVSTQTISRVINGRTDVASETRLRVQSVIDRLGYRPSEVARSLIGQRTHTIGVVGSSVEYFGPARTLSGIERQAAALGFSVMLSLLHEPESGDAESIFGDMLSRQVEGIIWAVPEIGDNRRWVRDLAQPSTPTVFLSMQPQPDLAIVSLDNRTGSRLATDHLLSLGRRNIALITGPLSWWEARQRRLGWQDALTAAGLSPEARQLVEGNWNASSGATAFARLRAEFPEMDGVVVSNDQMAQGVLHAAWSVGVGVPEDLAVVGFDDIAEAAYFVPPLTTIRQEPAELGSTAVRVLGRLIEAWHSTGRISTLESVSLRPELVVRESSVGKSARGAT